MSKANQNIDNHWVVHMSTENRVSGNHLNMVEGSAERILEMDNGKCLPDRNEHAAQRDNYADLVSRIVVDNIHNLLKLLSKNRKVFYYLSASMLIVIMGIVIEY